MSSIQESVIEKIKQLSEENSEFKEVIDKPQEELEQSTTWSLRELHTKINGLHKDMGKVRNQIKNHCNNIDSRSKLFIDGITELTTQYNNYLTTLEALENTLVTIPNEILTPPLDNKVE